MKTNLFTKKLPVWLAVSGAILLVGLILFFVLGFNVSASEKDSKSVAVTYDSYLTLDDELLTRAEDTCLSVIENYPVRVKEVRNSTNVNGGCFEFIFDASTDTAVLETVKDAALTALSSTEDVSRAYYTASVISYETEFTASYVGRFAIAGACVLVLAFAYVTVRFRFGAGVTVAALALHDVLLTLALTAIVRIPVGASLVAAIAFSLVYSLLLSVLSFVEIRTMRKDENLKAMPEEEALELVSDKARKTVCLISAITAAGLVIIALISLFASVKALLFALPACLAILVSTYSSICLLPCLYLPLKAVADKRAEKKATKYEKAEKKAVAETSETAKENDID